jgi:CheY-like chemotaxis protein
MPELAATILVVDDDPDVLEYAGSVLEECGYTVLSAASGQAALALLNANAQVDLLFTDIVMPGMDGFEVARQAAQRAPGLKVLFTSGFSNDIAHATRLLRKPYRPQQLAGEIAATLAE